MSVTWVPIGGHGSPADFYAGPWVSSGSPCVAHWPAWVSRGSPVIYAADLWVSHGCPEDAYELVVIDQG